MSSQSQSKNPTSYMGVLPINPCNVVYHRRDPLPSDFRNFVIGDRWVNEINLSVWTLVGKTAIDGTWVQGGGGSALVTSLNPDTGGVVPPTLGIINVYGDATQGVSTTNSGASTLTITVADASTTQKGVLELATNAEAIAGTNTTKAITPDDLVAKLGPLTPNGILIGEGPTAAIGSMSAGVAGQIVTSSGPAVDPVWTTATYPATTAQGDLLSSTTANAIVTLAKNTTATRYLANTGAGNNAQWNQVNLANGVTGVLPVANGGTGVSQIPSFSAYKSSTTANVTGTGINYRYICDVVDFNVGSGYNNGTGVFTAPVAGKYLFTTRCAVTGCTIAIVESLYLVATGKTAQNVTNRPPSTTDLNCEVTQVISMAASDTCYPVVATSGEAANTDDVVGNTTAVTSFCGVWVGP